MTIFRPDRSPKPALSLFGFDPADQAKRYLQHDCAPDARGKGRERWAAARARLRIDEPVPKVGNPDMELITGGSGYQYVTDLCERPTFKHRFEDTDKAIAQFAWIEPGPLVAFQRHVLVPRAESHIGNDFDVTNRRALLDACLPFDFDKVTPVPSQLGTTDDGRFVIEVDDLNYRILGPVSELSVADAELSLFALPIGVGTPLVSAVRFNGRTFLSNGYHRVSRLAALGAERIPCLFIEATDFVRIGARPGHFERRLIESEKPPTLAHFAHDRATVVQLRPRTRKIEVAWKMTQAV